MNMFIVDPAVHSRGGHHYVAIDRLQAELSRLGIDAACLGSAVASPDVVRALDFTATFTRSDDAHSVSISSTDAPPIIVSRIMVAYRFRTHSQMQL